MTVYTRAQEIVAAVGDAGVRATLDQRNVNPPCVLVTMPTAEFDVFAGHVTATWRLLVIAAGPPSADTFRQLWDTDGLLPILDRIDGIDIDSANPTTWTDNTTTVEITWQEAV